MISLADLSPLSNGPDTITNPHTMPAPKGNANARKAPSDLLNIPTIIRSTAAERAAWLKAASGQKFNAWARRLLNAAAGYTVPTNDSTK